MKQYIEIKNAHIHNLKGIDVKIPKNKLTVITGVSGSGKSSLAFDTLYEEGRKRYPMFSGAQLIVDKENTVDDITGLSPTVAVEQRIIRQSNPRSTVGIRTQIETLLASLYANFGKVDEGYETDEPLTVPMFQKNSPRGMCPKCMGKGYFFRLDEERMLPDKNIRIEDLFSDICDTGMMWRKMEKYRRTTEKSTTRTFAELSEDDYDELMYGVGPHYEGLALWLPHVEEWAIRSKTSWAKKIDCVDKIDCKRCEGTGLGREVAHTKIGGKTITELQNMYISDLYVFLHNLPGEKSPLQKEIEKKLACLIDVGLHHLALSRTVPSLSGGEIQRLFLSSYILAEMDSIIFIFDEPTIGLHEIEKANLISIIKRLITIGNTVVCVEHDESFMREADYIIDIGPGAGVNGGSRIYEGGFEEFMNCHNSVTAPYLMNHSFPVKHVYRQPIEGKIMTIKNATLHNLQNVEVNIPLEVMVGVAGVSGSGKSSLISDTLVPYLKEMMNSNCITGDHKVSENDFEDDENNFAPGDESDTEVTIDGIENIKRCYVIDQRPIGRSRTSCPATYTGIMDRIRKLYANTQKAKELGFDAGHFSLNSKGGCPACKGDGEIHYHVGFGNFINVKCEACNGYGFAQDTMSVNIQGKSIRDVLDMSVDEAYDFFESLDGSVANVLATLKRVGMGYIKLGQPTPTISGGESQRIKLAKELAKGKRAKNCLYILDEPTTGLSFADSEKLLELLNELVDKGNTIIITEHDPYILSNCDRILELGPGGGKDGGFLIAEGTPEELKVNTNSIIGGYLK